MTDKPKNKGGRPRKKIDYAKLDGMCAVWATGEECAAVLGIDYDTLNRALKRDGHGGFAEYSAQKGAISKVSLRRRQLSKAMDGDGTMLVWLGKQKLDQRDQQYLDQRIDAEHLHNMNLTVEFVGVDDDDEE